MTVDSTNHWNEREEHVDQYANDKTMMVVAIMMIIMVVNIAIIFDKIMLMSMTIRSIRTRMQIMKLLMVFIMTMVMLMRMMMMTIFTRLYADKTSIYVSFLWKSEL